MDGSGYLIVVVIAGLLLAVVYGTVTKWHERVRDSPESEHIVDRIGKNEQEAKSGIHNTITQQQHNKIPVFILCVGMLRLIVYVAVWSCVCTCVSVCSVSVYLSLLQLDLYELDKDSATTKSTVSIRFERNLVVCDFFFIRSIRKSINCQSALNGIMKWHRSYFFSFYSFWVFDWSYASVGDLSSSLSFLECNNVLRAFFLFAINSISPISHCRISIRAFITHAS